MKANFGIRKENNEREKEKQPRNLMENHFYEI